MPRVRSATGSADWATRTLRPSRLNLSERRPTVDAGAIPKSLLPSNTPKPNADAIGANRLTHLSIIARIILALVLCLSPGAATAQALDSLIERLDKLEKENRQLRREIDELKAERTAGHEAGVTPAGAPPEGQAGEYSRVDPPSGYAILDPTTAINRKQRLILARKRDGTLGPDSVHLHGAVTAVVNYQASNRADKFGYLMRHPTASNQVGQEVSEATIHSAQFGFTAMLGDWISGHAVMLFDPEQSFGKGTNTDLERNQVQVRRAHVLLGNLDRTPFFASLGKMAVPFGLTDTVNPFTASTVWHAFGALANGASVGYASEDLNLTAMGIQGGSQFRAANTPVSGSNVPSRVNNFAVDVNYAFRWGRNATFLLGGSYLHGSAYCQDFPITHFMPCRVNNPAFDVYGRLVHGALMFVGEFARTIDVWPGTFNPGMPEFAASEVTAFSVGARYRLDIDHGPVDLSAEFSRFEAGPGGAPWEKQDQFVVGAAWFVRPSVKLFAEYVRVEGFAPLNFISGGSIRDEDGNVLPDRTISDAGTRSDVFLAGVNVAF